MNGNVATARPYGGQAAGGQDPRESSLSNLGRTAEALGASIDELEKRLNPVLSPEGPTIANAAKLDTPPHNEIRNLAGRFEAAQGRLARLISRIDL